ncbi:MAG: ABC transporter permease [Candidatus Promineifilaceae bacterium]|nr:ABC transporter permease [Candidatus Promineifilaceae bacterium]
MELKPKVKQKPTYPKRVRPPLIDIFGTVLLLALAFVPLFALFLPMAVIVIVSFDSGPILRFPPEAFSFERYAAILELGGFLDSVRLSIIVALAVVAIDMLLGVPASIALVRGKFPGKSFIIGFLQSPMMIPGIVVGISMLFYVSFAGFNVSVPLMTLSHVVITLPFVIAITYARMQSADVTLEEAGKNLGAGSWQVFRHILLPYLMPGIVGGAAFAFLLSLDNLPTSLFTAPIIDVPMPVYLFRLLIYNINPIVAPIATLQIILTLVVLFVASRTIGTGALVGER